MSYSVVTNRDAMHFHALLVKHNVGSSDPIHAAPDQGCGKEGDPCGG